MFNRLAAWRPSQHIQKLSQWFGPHTAADTACTDVYSIQTLSPGQEIGLTILRALFGVNTTNKPHSIADIYFTTEAAQKTMGSRLAQLGSFHRQGEGERLGPQGGGFLQGCASLEARPEAGGTQKSGKALAT